MTIRLKKYLRGNIGQRVKKSKFATLDSDLKTVGFRRVRCASHRTANTTAQKLLRNFQALPTRHPYGWRIILTDIERNFKNMFYFCKYEFNADKYEK